MFCRIMTEKQAQDADDDAGENNLEDKEGPRERDHGCSAERVAASDRDMTLSSGNRPAAAKLVHYTDTHRWGRTRTASSGARERGREATAAKVRAVTAPASQQQQPLLYRRTNYSFSPD